jgi:hypothetical protein
LKKSKKRNVKLKRTRSPVKITNTISLIVDERSMLSQEIVALLEEAVAKTGHECGHAREDWGGAPSCNNVW